jgi:anti-sigma28 factor (negative regulator of flagellin synthesis)
MHVAASEMQQLPDIQVDKVEQLKHLVKSGSYWVPGEKIAERMLGEGLFA